ncbi:hypothetical protein [Methanimicrococcus hacksteinii]|uniref:hypothetical protein n=1 Tax=Methanimicrococcus hacksteinii TaxID=3028293 RepID=UPI00298F21A2|nr:hypothetical protein [Methanimicrococcus sp. At1]
MHHLIFITSARYASVGTDYLPASVCRRYLPASVYCICLAVLVNTVADLPACFCCRRRRCSPRAGCTIFQK